MGCRVSKRTNLNNVIQPVDAASVLSNPIVSNQSVFEDHSRKTTINHTKETAMKAADDRSELIEPAQTARPTANNYSLSDPKAVVSPKSVSFFNVVCWCNDRTTLQLLDQDPVLEYTPENSAQTIMFNRISALNISFQSLHISAVVYLVAHSDDIPLVRQFRQSFSHIWNHFIVLREDCEELVLPSDLMLPVLHKHHNLHKAIHESYLDQLVVLDGFFAQDKSTTVLSRKEAIIKILTKDSVEASSELTALRKFWTENRLRLWNLKEGIAKLARESSARVSTVLKALTACMSSPVDLTEGNLHFTFGDTGRNYQSQLNVHFGTNTIMEHIALPTASLIKYSDKECWICLSLSPNPECITNIDNSVLAMLAKSTYERITQHAPNLADLFGYDIQYVPHRLVQGKLYLCFWLSLSHARVRDNRDVINFLQVVQSLDRDQEVKGSYKSVLTASDFILKTDGNLLSVLLDDAVATLKWSLTVPLWRLITTLDSSSVRKACEWVSNACAFSDVDMSFENASDLPSSTFPAQLSLSALLSFAISALREPLESAPSVMRQINTALEFYEPKVKIVGRIRNLGVEVSGEVPNLAVLLQHRKTFPFL